MRRLLPFAICLLLVSVALSAQTPDVARATIEIHCTRILDGDTIEIRGGDTVRLLGINTPETGEPYADQAKWALYDWVAHKTLKLEVDEQERDIYNRLLAHVYVETDEGWINVNAELVRAGLARVLFIPPNARYRDFFDAALEEAILKRLGIWGAVGGELSVEELEADLMTCITEMVTVSFTIASVKETSQSVKLYADEGEFGFYVKIPAELVPELEVESVEELIGLCAIATGIVDCERVGLGPSILLEYAEQLTIPCPEPELSN